jgi:DNA-binding response OmpR family regulator
VACKDPIHLSRKSNGSRPKQISAIRSDDQGGPELFSRAPNQECDANAFPVALGVLLEPEGPPVTFIVGRESVLNGSSGLHILSSGAPALAPFPFSFEELVTRLRAAIRHSNALTDNQVTCFGDVRVNFATMEVTRLGEPLILKAQELKTLKFFVLNPYRVISREELLNEAWGYHNYPSTRTVDNHVLKLRQKLESDPADPVHFLTVHRVGYRFVP